MKLYVFVADIAAHFGRGLRQPRPIALWGRLVGFDEASLIRLRLTIYGSIITHVLLSHQLRSMSDGTLTKSSGLPWKFEGVLPLVHVSFLTWLENVSAQSDSD